MDGTRAGRGFWRASLMINESQASEWQLKPLRTYPTRRGRGASH